MLNYAQNGAICHEYDYISTCIHPFIAIRFDIFEHIHAATVNVSSVSMFYSPQTKPALALELSRQSTKWKLERTLDRIMNISHLHLLYNQAG